MNNKITLYELLGLVKDGQAPKKIKVDDGIYEYRNGCIDYIQSKIKNSNYWLFKDYLFGSNGNRLNDEVEILDDEDEEKKIPEKLPYYSMEKIQKAKNKDEWREERITLLEKRVNDLHIKMNDLLDYLKSKGDE